MEVMKVPKKIVTVIEPKRSMTVDKEKYRQKKVAASWQQAGNHLRWRIPCRRIRLSVGD